VIFGCRKFTPGVAPADQDEAVGIVSILAELNIFPMQGD
jgi:hypothetical protein